MMKLAVLAGAVSLLSMAGAANAAVIVNDSDAVGTQYVVDFTGQANGSAAPDLSSVLTLTFNGTSNGGATYNFGYNLVNDSSVTARLRSFGFDITDATLASASSTGTYGTVGYNDTFPEGLGTLDVCFRAAGGSNCTGGPNGLWSGSGASGAIALNFAGPLGSIALDNFATRYQSISPAVNGATSGVGIGTPGAVPEPATWALMILGFGAVGMAMRRRNMSTSKIAYA